MSKVIVIGGGASGLMAAYAALKNNNEVILFEKNEKLGKKLYITGKGRCNLTNDVLPSEFLENVISNPKFLLGSINTFTPEDTISFFESRHTPLKIERGGRVFPLSDKASDITNCLVKEITKLGCEIHLNEKVKEIIIEKNKVKGVKTDLLVYNAAHIICSTGGLSYPLTGSTGDGYKFAHKTGHKIIEAKPALVGLNIKEEFVKELQGLSLINIRLTAKKNNKTIAQLFGEMIFTHFGISGPVVLSLSSKINRLNLQDTELFIDLKPALTIEVLDARVLRDFAVLKGKLFKNSLDLLLPKKLIPIIIQLSGIDEFKRNDQITKAERENLVEVIKNLKLHISSLRPIEEGIITAGGVCVNEINPKTMESKLIQGLHFCGEVLDLDALTGGYNIQIAFSTGYCAGNSIIS